MADKLRPGIILVWLGLLASVGSLLLMKPPGAVGATLGGQVLMLCAGVFSPFIIIALNQAGAFLAWAGAILATWGFIVTLVHKTGAYILAGFGLALAALAAARGLGSW